MSMSVQMIVTGMGNEKEFLYGLMMRLRENWLVMLTGLCKYQSEQAG